MNLSQEANSPTSGCQLAYIRMPTRLRQEANSPTPNGQLAYVGELTIRRRRVGVGEFARRRVDRKFLLVVKGKLSSFPIEVSPGSLCVFHAS